MMQNTIVAIIVLVAVWKVIARYAPKSVGHAMHRFLLGLLRRIGLSALAGRLAAKKLAASGGSCGGCNACSPADAQSTGTPAAIKEFSISPEELRRTAHR